jgi:hypothetical protein
MTQPAEQERRGGLAGLMDRYLDALSRNDPWGLPLAEDVRFTENAMPLALGTGLWATATSVPAHDYAHVEDPERGTIAWFGVIGESGRPAVVFVRLTARDGAICEVETIVRREAPRLFDPANMTAPREIVFTELPPSERSSRAELEAVGNSYFDGLVAVDGDMIPVGESTTRIENGAQTVRVTDVSHLPEGAGSRLIFPMGVREQVNSGYFSYMDAIRDRRVVAVDESRGLVTMVVVFDHSGRMQSVPVKGVGEVELPPYHRVPNSVLVAELFKVRGGVIEHIEAVLEFMPYGVRTGWED